APLSAIASRAFLFSLGFGHLGGSAGCIAGRFFEPVSRARATSSKTARNTHSRSARRNHSDHTYEPWISSLLVDLMSPTASYHRWSRTSWRTSKLSWGVLGFPLPRAFGTGSHPRGKGSQAGGNDRARRLRAAPAA